MDAIQLLGSLLGGQQIASPSGRRVLQGAHPALRTRGATTRTRSAPTQRASTQPARGGLGGLLRAAADQYMQRQAQKQARQQTQGHRDDHQHHQEQAPPPQRQAASDPHHGHEHCDDPYGGLPRDQANERAVLLIRAMVNAAKADGRVDYQEEAQITKQFGGQLSRDQTQFLQQEFASRLDLNQFARSVPRGLEDDVYVASLIAIDLDTNQEARYLQELGHALGLSHDQCNQIHQRYGEPLLYR